MSPISTLHIPVTCPLVALLKTHSSCLLSILASTSPKIFTPPCLAFSCHFTSAFQLPSKSVPSAPPCCPCLLKFFLTVHFLLSFPFFLLGLRD